MAPARTSREKATVTVALVVLVWVVGSTLLYGSGGINPAAIALMLGSVVIAKNY